MPEPVPKAAAFLAVLLLLAVAVVRASASAPPPQSELLALQALYNSTNGTGWFWRNDTTRYGIPWNFTNIREQDPCAAQFEWQGITCNSFKNKVNIVGLILPHFNLRGPLSDLDQLTELNTLDLEFNNLTSTLPSSLGALTLLKNLNLY